jgi:putative PEP-CTERM system TPR-repeat lipoprotein
MQNFEAATDAVKKSLSLQPDYLDAQLVQIGLEVRAGRHEQALGITRQIQKQRGDSPVGYIAEGDVLTSQKKFDAAVKAYEKAFMVNKSGQMLVKLHESLGRAGKAQEADARMKQWLKEHPNDTHARLYLAATSLANQRNKEAIEQYQAVLQQDQKNVMALNNLAFALQQEKDPRAMEYAEKALALAPDNPGVLDTAGWILVEQGNTTRGLPLLQKAASLAPSVSDISYHLAQALVKSGDNAGAKKELEQLLASGKPISKADEAKLLLKQIQ